MRQVVQILIAALANNAGVVRGFGLPKTHAVHPLKALYSKTDAIEPTSEAAVPLSTSRWENFDYGKHWYPVTWICDLRPNQPTKVTLFDIDYVVAIDGDTENPKITALLDICPHKAAALSEGRMTATGSIQCAYHGWSFDGESGACLQIPQASALTAQYSARTCAKSIPAVVHQGMLWLWPGPVKGTLPTPPTIPELDDPKFTVTRVVRDFPIVDWTLLVSNILDPDHGLFAHQAKPFDWYSASSEFPLKVEETFEGPSWHLKTSVPAVEKLLAVDKNRRGIKPDKKKTKKDKTPEPQYLATSEFMAPTTITLCRRPDDDPDAPTKFMSAFWVSPTGTGRSRFFSASISSIPLKIPRWFVQLNLNDFLDQDTVLVASQQPGVLTAEAEGKGRCSSLFAYASPTDRSVRLIDQFWDAVAASAPNRKATLQEMHRSGQLRHTPDRRVVLDRQVQHLDICPDSQDAVKNAKRIRNLSLVTVASWIVGSIVKRSMLKFRWVPVVAALTAWVSNNVQKGFYFCYPASKRNRDLKKINDKTWQDGHDR